MCRYLNKFNSTRHCFQIYTYIILRVTINHHGLHHLGIPNHSSLNICSYETNFFKTDKKNKFKMKKGFPSRAHYYAHNLHIVRILSRSIHFQIDTNLVIYATK